MHTVLRIIDPKGMKEYDLTSRKTPISAGSFTVFQQGGSWRFQSEEAVFVNGEKALEGKVRLYDVYYIDETADRKALVLPVREGEKTTLPAAVGWTFGRIGQKAAKTGGNTAICNAVELHDRSVSSEHCVVYKPNKKHLYVTDLDSTNGTFLGSRRLKAYQPCRMKQYDILTVGPYQFGCFSDGKEVFLQLLNLDDDVRFHPEFLSDAEKKARKYSASVPELNLKFAPKIRTETPFVYAGPRNLPARPSYAVTIESAPSVNTAKPGMGSFGIGVNLPAMAIGFGMQALNYALSKKKYSKAEQERADFYARYTSKIENELSAFQKEELAYANRLYPPIEDCMKRLQSPYRGLFERHFGDEDFLCVRLGTGTVPTEAKITVPPSRLSMTEDIFERVPGQIQERYSNVSNMPVSISLQKDGVLGVVGAKQETDALIRSLIWQIVTLHNYDEVKLVLLCDTSDLPEWGWMRWLPHVFNDSGEYRYIITGPEDLKECFGEETNQLKNRINPDKGWSYSGTDSLPYYVFIVLKQELLFDTVIGQALMSNREELSATGIVAGRAMAQIPYSVRGIAEIRRNGTEAVIALHQEEKELPVTKTEKTVDAIQCDRLARRLAPVRMSGAAVKKKYVLPENVGFFEGMGLTSKEEIYPEKRWGRQKPEDSMAVPIGIDENGRQVIFNIHENGQGPHGLVAGGTGSGKSKMIQSWIGSMGCHFSPEEVNFVLVDFKGESLLTPFKNLPHLACFTSNLDPDVRRKFLAISSELKRRQSLIREYSCGDIVEYRRLRQADTNMPNLPFLILVVDEFASFKTEYPEFTEPLDELFQKGRSLGFYAILMTQNPSGKVTAQMTANLGFRWCLRVDSEADSREVIGTPDAARIHNPGRVYFTSNKDGTYKLLQAFYGAQPYNEEKLQKGTDDAVYALKPNGGHIHFTSAQNDSAAGVPDELQVLSDTLADYCKKHNIAAARPIWQPELPKLLDLRTLTGNKENLKQTNAPAAILGLFDDPANQRQAVLRHDLWEDGTLAVYGAPQSGKTTFLETFLLSLAERYQPAEAQFYILEYGGFRLEGYRDLPHTGGYANDTDPECIRRIIRYLKEELASRMQLFHRLHVSSMEGCLEVKKEPLPAICLIIDNINSFLQQYGELQTDIAKLIREGSAYGMNVIATITGTGGVYSIAPFIRRSYALRLSDSGDYAGIVAPVRMDVSDLPPGRGFLNKENTALQFQTAILYADLPDAKRRGKTIEWIGERQKTCTGPLPVQILSMPESIFYGDLKGTQYLLGMDSETIQPYSIPFDKERSLLVSYRKKESCRSFLRSLIRQVQETGGEAYLYSKDAGEYADLVDKEHRAAELPELNRIVEYVHAELKNRQEKFRQNPNISFPIMMLITDGMQEIIKEAPPDTSQWLEAFIQLSEGLGYAFVGCDVMERMNEIKYTTDNILAISACKGPGMMIGGRISEHRIVAASSMESFHPGELAWDEAVLSAENELHLLKLMQGD